MKIVSLNLTSNQKINRNHIENSKNIKDSKNKFLNLLELPGGTTQNIPFNLKNSLFISQIAFKSLSKSKDNNYIDGLKKTLEKNKVAPEIKEGLIELIKESYSLIDLANETNESKATELRNLFDSPHVNKMVNTLKLNSRNHFSEEDTYLSFKDYLERNSLNSIKETDPKSFAELKSLYRLFHLREAMRIEILPKLNDIKNSEELLSCNKDLSNVVEDLDEKIRCLGLDENVKKLVKDTRLSVGVRINVPNSYNLANRLFENLQMNKDLKYVLPEEVNLLDFVNTNGEVAAASAFKDESNGNYRQKLDYNPIYLIGKKSSEVEFAKAIKHEIAHVNHLDNMKDNYSSLSYLSILSKQERQIYEDSLNSIKGAFFEEGSLKKCVKIIKDKQGIDINSKDLTHSLKEALKIIKDEMCIDINLKDFKSVSRLLSHYENFKKMGLKDEEYKNLIILSKMVSYFDKKFSSDSLEDMTDNVKNCIENNLGNNKELKDLNKKLLNCKEFIEISLSKVIQDKDIIKYALLNPHETVAVATQYSNVDDYSPEFLKFLYSMGMSKFHDREYITKEYR